MCLEKIVQYFTKYMSVNKNIDTMYHVTPCAILPHVAYCPVYHIAPYAKDFNFVIKILLFSFSDPLRTV